MNKLINLCYWALNCGIFFLFSCVQDNKFIKLNGSEKMKNQQVINHEFETPIIDRKIFFGNPKIVSASLSPDSKWITFLKEYNGIMNIWIKNFDDAFENAIPLTDSTRPLSGYFWTKDNKYIIYAKDNDGDENTNVYLINPFTAEKNKLPQAINLTPQKNVKAYIYKVSYNNPDVIMIGLNDRDKAWHDLYKLTISTRKLEKLFINTNRISGYVFDWDDNLQILYRTDEKGNTEFLKIDKNGKLDKIYEVSVNEQADIVAWNKDNTKAYIETNKGILNLSELYLFDINSLKLTKVESDPENKVDFGGILFNLNTRDMIYTSYIADKIRYYWKDKKWEEYYNYLTNKFPNREVSFASSDKDYSKFLVSVGGDKYAYETYLFDPNAKDNEKLIYQYTSRPELKEIEQYLSSMNSISYKSSDGLEISGYLTIPAGKKALDLPLVVFVHGGPKGPRDFWGYNPTVQFLANRGYAVLQPNYRASGGFGKKFLNAGDLQWGKLMQDDITWGVKYLIDQGIVNKNKVVIMGGSYGGYATLAGLAFTPDVYVAGVDIVGPSNLFTLLDSVPPYWEAGRAFLYAMIGDPNTPEGKQRIQESSPLFSVNNINKPLLIVQGANDPRVKQAESDQIVIALRNKGKQVTYILADDEGHGYANPINKMAMYAEIEKFLANILDERYQQYMPTDVQKRLKELTVDVEKVTYIKTN